MEDRDNCPEETTSNLCPICLDPLQEPCSTPCGHIFCKQCITLVIFSSNSSSEKYCPICITPITAYVIKVVRTGKTLLPTPLSPKIIGSVYNQHGIPGLAAYHFESEENCYISYASPRCSQWPDLDNGERPPLKKPFTNVSINEDERVFKGDIIWAPTSWEGNVVWSYEMHFSEDYQTIPEGQLVEYNQLERIEPHRTLTFGEDLVYARSFEHDHLMMLPNLRIVGGVYVQGNTLGLASYHFESEEDCYISYASSQCAQWPDLENGERPPAKKPFVNISIDDDQRMFKGDIVWAPTSWNGDKLWQYEMRFSEDYGTIIGGKVEAFDAVECGNLTRTHTFGVNLSYKRYIVNDFLQMIQDMDNLEL